MRVCCFVVVFCTTGFWMDLLATNVWTIYLNQPVLLLQALPQNTSGLVAPFFLWVRGVALAAFSPCFLGGKGSIFSLPPLASRILLCRPKF